MKGIQIKTLFFILTLDLAWTLDDSECGIISTAGEKHNVLFPTFEQITLEYYIKRSYSFPTCVLFLTETQNAIKIVSKLSYFLTNTSKQNLDWNFGSYRLNSLKNSRYISNPKSLPTFRCYFGIWEYEDYSGNGHKSHFHKWLNHLAENHGSRIPEADSETLDDYILSLDLHTDLNVMLAFPGPDPGNHARLKHILHQMKENFEQVHLLMVHSLSSSENVLKTRFSVHTLPTLLIFEPKHYKRGCKTSTLQLLGDQITQDNLEEYLALKFSTAINLSKRNFEREVMDQQFASSPILVLFYWPRSGKVTRPISAFHHSQDIFTAMGATLRFGLLDLSTNREVLLRWVDASHAKGHPFLVLFWSEKTGKKELKFHQKLLATMMIPTPWQVYSFMEENGAPFVDMKGHPLIYSPWQDSKPVDQYGFTNMKDAICYAMSNVSSEEMTDIPIAKWTSVSTPKKRARSTLEERGSPNSGYEADQIWWKMARDGHPDLPALKRVGNLSLLTEQTWSQVVERSHAPGHPLEGGLAWRGEVSSVVLVVFVQAGCGACDRKMATVFQRISRAVNFIDGGSAYLLNCTSDPVVCREQGIVGFPTLMAYRGLGWLGSEPCLSDSTTARYTRLTYHGALLEREIMEWFSEISRPAVNRDFVEDLKELKMDQTVRLVGTLYPRGAAARLLRTVAAGHWFPYPCFRLLCERLYGAAACFASLSSSLPPDATHRTATDMIVTQIEMFRKDGVSTLLAAQGTPLTLTLHEQASPRLHTFHRPHRYNIPAGQKCEDDPAFCTELIIRFVGDHQHLPVTQLTVSTFHTLYSGDSSESKTDLPLLIALAHHENISSSSTPLMKVLTEVAYELYNQMMVVTVDIDAFPGWAAQFVPYNYRRHILDNSDLISEDQVPSLYLYPRLCIVQWRDHGRAAFHPPLPPDTFRLVSRHRQQEQMSGQHILQFAHDFLQHPDRLLRKTEQF